MVAFSKPTFKLDFFESDRKVGTRSYICTHLFLRTFSSQGSGLKQCREIPQLLCLHRSIAHRLAGRWCSNLTKCCKSGRGSCWVSLVVVSDFELTLCNALDEDVRHEAHIIEQYSAELFPPFSVVVIAAVFAMSSKTSRNNCTIR